MTPMPVLFTVGGVSIYSHGFFLLVALLAGLGWLLIEARRRRWSKSRAATASGLSTTDLNTLRLC
mgnify:CR=1 FL=1